MFHARNHQLFKGHDLLFISDVLVFSQMESCILGQWQTIGGTDQLSLGISVRAGVLT